MSTITRSELAKLLRDAVEATLDWREALAGVADGLLDKQPAGHGMTHEQEAFKHEAPKMPDFVQLYDNGEKFAVYDAGNCLTATFDLADENADDFRRIARACEWAAAKKERGE